MVHSNLKYFNIILYNTCHTYMAGSSICGCVEISVLDRFKINGVKIKIVGDGKISWTEKREIMVDLSHLLIIMILKTI